jgi:hypothetical protein
MDYGLVNGTYDGLYYGLGRGLSFAPQIGLINNFGCSMQAETIAWFAQVPLPKPSMLYTLKINMLVRNLKQANIWGQLDRFWIFATEQQTHAKVSLVNPKGLNSAWAPNITEVNSPSWTKLVGYTGNGTNSYLNSNYNPSTDGINMSLNSATIGEYSRKSSNSVGNYTTDIGCYDGTHETLLACKPNAIAIRSIISAADAADDSTLNNLLSLMSGQRTNSTTVGFYQRGALVQSFTSNSTALTTKPFYLLAQNQNGSPLNYSPRQISMAFIGSGNINQTLLYNIFQSFALNIGFYV